MASTPQHQHDAAPTVPPTDSSTRIPRDLLGISTAVQAGFTVRYGWAYWELTRVGVTSLLTALISTISCVLLYVGIVRLLTGRRVKHSLLLATTGFAWSFFGWGVRYSWSHPFLLGAIVGTVAWWWAVKMPTKPCSVETGRQ